MSVAKVIDDKYEVHRELKRGGFGLIYKGVDRTFGKSVAIKAVEPSLLGEAKYIDMFQAEALNIAQFSHHNIVHVYDIKRDPDGQFYIIMEFIDGPDMGTLIKESKAIGRPIPLHLALYIIAESCAGLDYAHNRRDSRTNEPLNIVHQDISPSNIMITRSGEVKLIDFGMANLRRKQPQHKNEVVIQGKLNYIVPELVQKNHQLDRRADIFALGLVLYEILTGERVIKESTPDAVINLLRSGTLDLSLIEGDSIPVEVRNAIKKALEIDPDKRYPTANHFYMDLMQQLIIASQSSDFMAELSTFIEETVPQPDEPVSEQSPFAMDFESNKSNGQDSSQSFSTSKPLSEIERELESLQNGPVEEKDEPVTSTHGIDSEASPSSDRGYSGEHQSATENNEEETQVIDETSFQTDSEENNKSSFEQELEESLVDIDINESVGSYGDGDKSNSNYEIFDETKSGITVLDSESNSKSESYFSSPNSSSKPYESSFKVNDLQGEEELKTIIDVVRLSTRNHKKSIIVTTIVFFVAFLGYTVFDTMVQRTSYGIGIYDILFPPAAKIESFPAGAQVYLDDQLLPERTPLRIEDISPGIHKLNLVHERFESITRSINVPGQGAIQVTGEEERDPGVPYTFRFTAKLHLTSQPEGADIIINGTKISSKTPTTINWELTEEPVNIQMSLAGFPDLQGLTINSEDGSEFISDRRFWKFSRNDIQKDDFAIEGIFRKFITIKSIPSRAEIYLNDSERPVGVTGINGELALTSGKHKIALRKAGYISKSRTIEVTSETAPQITEALLRNVQLSVIDASAPEDGDISAKIISLRGSTGTININRRTPTQIRVLPYKYEVFIQKSGYKDKIAKIGHGDMRIQVALEPIPADVTIRIVDSINNEAVNAVQVSYKSIHAPQEPEQSLGVTDEQGEFFTQIPPGTYQFTINKPGYQSVTKNLRVRTERRNRLTFRLTMNN